MMKEAIGYHQVFGDILRGMEMIEKMKHGRCDCINMPEAEIASSFHKKPQRMCKVGSMFEQ
jgi:cyclophilin family peptidyl-prolyl cis-trans isomerase